MSRGFTSAVIILGVVFFITVATVTFYLGNFSVPQPQKTEVAKITPKSSPTPIPTDETANPDSIGANWKTYRNADFGYEIQYPSNWDIIEARSGVTESEFGQKLNKDEVQKVTFTHDFIGGEPALFGAFVQIIVTPNSSNLTPMQTASKKYPQTKISDVNFAGKTGVLVKPLCCSYPEPANILILNNKYLFIITYDDISADDKNPPYNQVKKVDDQILSTFKFLPDSDEGKFCGGIVANLPENQCPTGYKCQLDGNYPDAGGKCVKSQ